MRKLNEWKRANYSIEAILDCCLRTSQFVNFKHSVSCKYFYIKSLNFLVNNEAVTCEYYVQYYTLASLDLAHNTSIFPKSRHMYVSDCCITDCCNLIVHVCVTDCCMYCSSSSVDDTLYILNLNSLFLLRYSLLTQTL